VTGVIGLASLERAIGEKFPAAIAERNVAAARAAFEAAKSAKETIGA